MVLIIYRITKRIEIHFVDLVRSRFTLHRYTYAVGMGKSLFLPKNQVNM